MVRGFCGNWRKNVGCKYGSIKMSSGIVTRQPSHSWKDRTPEQILYIHIWKGSLKWEEVYLCYPILSPDIEQMASWYLWVVWYGGLLVPPAFWIGNSLDIIHIAITSNVIMSSRNWISGSVHCQAETLAMVSQHALDTMEVDQFQEFDCYCSKQDWVAVSNIFYCHPYLGKIPMVTNIFQMGWNHQLEEIAMADFFSTYPNVFFANLEELRDIW